MTTLLPAQTLEPRLYSNAPTDLSFLVVGYAYSQGALANNPSLELQDPNLHVNSAFLAFATVFSAFSQSAKFNFVIPITNINGTAKRNGDPINRNLSGLADSKVRISFNLFGAPALSLKDYASYKQDTIVGVSLQATLPTGQYDNSKLVNIGTNRWAIKPSIGISKAISRLILEFAADAEFYTENSDFYGGHTRKQAPVYSTQAHAIYTFDKGIWLGIDINYFIGGEYSNDGVKSGESLANSRLGATLALPLNRRHSLKINASSGVSTRVGTNFDTIGIAWQIRFADGM